MCWGKGMGIAAPQISIDRSAAVIRSPGTDDVVTLTSLGSTNLGYAGVCGFE